jgi:RHS repeat-associated protein
VALEWRGAATTALLRLVAVLKLEVLFSGGQIDHCNGSVAMNTNKSLSLRATADATRQASAPAPNTGLPYDRHFAGMQGFESPESLYPTDFRKYTPALGRWMSPDPMGGDVTNPQSLNRYAYVTNNPTTFTDPLGLYNPFECDPLDPIDCGPPPCDPEVWNDCGPCIPGFGCPPVGGGGGGRGGHRGSAGGAPAPPSAPPAGQPPLRGGAGFISPNDAAVWEQVEQQFPSIAQTVWACAFLPVCQEGLATAVAVTAAGVLVYEGIQVGVQIYQSSSKARFIRDVEKAYCLKPNVLGAAIHGAKKGGPSSPGYDLSEQEIKDIAADLAKDPRNTIPGCVPHPF